MVGLQKLSGKGTEWLDWTYFVEGLTLSA